MDTVDLYVTMRGALRAVANQCDRFSPKFRDGTARATWLEDGVNYAFDSWRAKLTLAWLLSDSGHTLTFSDFEVSEAALREFGIVTTTLADIEALMQERDRAKLLALFQLDGGDASPGARLNAISTAMAAAKDVAMALIDTTGDATTIKYVDVGGVTRKEGKTLAEMGLDGVPLADALDALSAEIKALVPVF